jgi:CheY-like chemotaxis protein
MGGTILLQSAPGRGSRFRVDLPVEIVGSADLGPESSGEHVIGLVEGQEDFRILIVEDQRENWILLQRLLEGVGFQTRVAEDGRHAVDLFRSWRPHFIWMDVILPHLNGFEAVKQIRELQGGRDVKIAVVTASAFGSRREEVLAAGFDDFLRKPYQPHAILDCMARHLKVRYVYGTPRPAEEVPGTVRVENLDALPEAMREELKSAVVALDRELIDHVIATIGERDEKLGRALKLLAGSFAYTSIFEALESCKQPA